jgi:hypothetical protein
MKKIKLVGLLLLTITFSNTIKAQSGTYNPAGSGEFFSCDLQEDGSIKLKMTIPSSARNMCEDFEGFMKKDSIGNFVCYLNGEEDSKNVIIGVVKSATDLINGLPKKIQVKNTNAYPCDVPKGIYTFNELGD